jgi:hypothetical protein
MNGLRNKSTKKLGTEQESEGEGPYEMKEKTFRGWEQGVKE